jgi:predicted ferric reductase
VLLGAGSIDAPYIHNVRGAVSIILYLLFILAPLFALLTGSLPPTRDFWTEFSVAIGYAGLAMMGLQFGLTARFRGARTSFITISTPVSWWWMHKTVR